MMRRYNRLLVAFYILSDALLGMAAFAIAYLLRFESGIADIIPVTKGQPPFWQYVNLLPLIGRADRLPRPGSVPSAARTDARR
jgi:hypothetical protein